MFKPKILLFVFAITVLGVVAAQVAGPGVHGIQEFQGPGTYTWTAPDGVNNLYVETWGAGGGGSMKPNTTRAGNGGGSGAYVRTALAVSPGQTYYVTVGGGGAGDTGSGKGAKGESSSVNDASGAQLTYAGGGDGGDKNATVGAAGGVPDPAAGLQRSGNRGKLSTGVQNYQGGVAVAGSVAAPYFMDGGAGNNGRGSGGPGGKGGSGYAILTW